MQLQNQKLNQKLSKKNTFNLKYQISSLTSSIYPLTVALNTPTITAANDILSSDISITSDMVKPGGGGILRLAFAFTFAVTPATVSVFNGTLKGNLNADNSAQVITDGYYRFDIDVESGDTINLQADQDITAIRFLRAHLVQFGA